MPAATFFPKKGGGWVEDKKYPPPLGIPINTGVPSDLVEVEVIFKKKFGNQQTILYLCSLKLITTLLS